MVQQPGDEVAGVRLTARLGRGGGGAVWAGTDLATGERVAVKVLHEGATAPAGERWRREAGLLAGLPLPHLLGLRRVSEDPPALVTELAVGGSLAAQVRARQAAEGIDGALGPGELVTVLLPLARTLAELHRRGVVHGDVTAANVLFVDLGRPVLGDLGSARSRRDRAGPGTVDRTPGYAAPEVLAGRRALPASDVYGLGAVAWFALTTSPPPADPDDRLPLRLLAPECPDALLEVVGAALAVEPGRRPDAAALAEAVRRAAPARPVRLVPAAARGVSPEEAVTFRPEGSTGAPPSPLSSGRAPRWARRRERRVRPGGGRVVAGTAAVLLGVAGAAAVASGLPGPGQAVGEEPRGPVVAPVPAPTGTAAPLHELVVAVVDRREAALRSGDPAALRLVHAADGTALAADEALLAAGPLAVSYEVVSVVPVTGRGDTADVTVVTRRAGHPVLREDVRLVLARDGGSWVLQAVTRPGA